jgi:hypothetical protein
MLDKSIAQKMLIKKGNKVLILGSPQQYLSKLGDLPDGVQVLTQPEGKVDILQVFVRSKDELEKSLGEVKNWLGPKSIFWLSYPKGSSKISTDINRDIIFEIVKKSGFIGVAMISLDETWSGFRCKEV